MIYSILICRKCSYLLLAFLISGSASVAQQILPNTVYCVKGSEANPVSYCVDETPCKTLDGHTVCLSFVQPLPSGAFRAEADCWKQQTDYTCVQYIENCSQYSSDSNCNEVGQRHCSTGSDGQPLLATHKKMGECSSYTRSFSCADPRKKTEESYTSTTECDITGMMNGVSWTTTTKSSAEDFIVAATGQEFARQLAVYGAKDSGGVNNLFPGSAGKCRDGYMGLKNCCKSSGGGAVSNGSTAQMLGLSAGLYGFQKGVGYAASRGSHYVKDTLFPNEPMFFRNGMEVMLDDGIANSWQNATFGAFGFGTTQVAAEGAVGGLFYGSTTSFTVGSQTLYFNPYALAASLAIQIVMDLMSCSQDEQHLARARAENLCHYVGDYCSNEVKFLGATIGCLETTQSYCCYNGQLGKAIGVAGRSQVGKGWGSANSPDCSGFTPTQLSAMDMNAPEMQAALEPFKQEIMRNFNNNAAPALQNGSIKTSISGRVGDNSQALCLQRQKLDPSTQCN